MTTNDTTLTRCLLVVAACALVGQDAGAAPSFDHVRAPFLQECQNELQVCASDLQMCSGDLASCEQDLAARDGELATCSTSLGTCEGDLAACEQQLASIAVVTATFDDETGVASGTCPSGNVVAGTVGVSDIVHAYTCQIYTPTGYTASFWTEHFGNTFTCRIVNFSESLFTCGCRAVCAG